MSKNNHYYICGTDTDIGKTLVCTGLLRNLKSAQAIKIIQTGNRLYDQEYYLLASPTTKVKTLFHFPLPASPHLAAQKINQILSVKTVSQKLKQSLPHQAITLLEGSGGILTPINQDETFLDLMATVPYPVILVVKNKLGAINHALLSIKVLQQRNIPILGFVLTTTQKEITHEEHIIAEDNSKIITSLGKIPLLATIPYIVELSHDDAQIREQGWQKVDQALQAMLPLFKQNNSNNEDLISKNFDQEHIWHPYAPIIDGQFNWQVKKTQGCHLYLNNGQQLIDGMSSWWSVIHGYNHPHIIKAMSQQIQQMPHIMFGGLTHEPALLLTKKLLSIAPKGLKHIFYADSGSVSVEVSIKIALQYWQQKGLKQKTKLISFFGGYHGDTFGAMSVCDPINGMHSLFKDVLMQNIFAPRPDAPFNETFNPNALDAIRKIIHDNHHQCCAVIIEPIVQGAGGMWFYHPQFLKGLHTICREYDVLLIVDEIATGFGRTGKLFACDWADITPDIMCIGKALTGGNISLAATLCTHKIAQEFKQGMQVLMHGPTFMANPLACRTALASIELLLQSPWQQKIKQIEITLSQELLPCKTLSGVVDIRILGAIAVIEMAEKVNIKKLQNYFIEQCGVWIRPFNHLIYIMPPFIIEIEQLQQLTHAMKQALKENIWL